MGITERREREKEYRRNMILDAAEKLFFSRGVHNTTMDDISETAELSKGTLYLYFKNKDDIYHAIHLRGLNTLKAMFEEAVATQKVGIKKVRAIGEAYYRFSEQYADYFNAMMFFESSEIDLSDPQTYGAKCHQCSEDIMAIVARTIKAGIEDGSIRSTLDPLKTAYLLWGQSTGVIQIMTRAGQHLREHHQIDPEALIPALFDFIYHALIPGENL